MCIFLLFSMWLSKKWYNITFIASHSWFCSYICISTLSTQHSTKMQFTMIYHIEPYKHIRIKQLCIQQITIIIINNRRMENEIQIYAREWNKPKGKDYRTFIWNMANENDMRCSCQTIYHFNCFVVSFSGGLALRFNLSQFLCVFYCKFLNCAN